MNIPHSCLSLLQLTNSALPIGSYSYSEGLETLIEEGVIKDHHHLQDWLTQELNYGSIRLEAAVMLRGYRSFIKQNITDLVYWNNWLTAAKETAELRQQSWQMGKSLLKLLIDLGLSDSILASLEEPCNYAIAFSLGAAFWELTEIEAVLGYLHSWCSNLITAGVKIIPLGQTTGQQILRQLHDIIVLVTEEIFTLEDEYLVTCNWGLTLASMNHETQYTRLFRS